MQINICNSKSTFDAITAGVSWAHKKMGFPSPTNHTLVKQLISSAHMMLGSLAVNRKLPLLRSHLKMLTEKYKFASLDFLQILTLITLGFVGFLRWDDLINLNISDLSFHDNHLAIFLEKCKNAQFRERSLIFLHRSGSFYCPVSLVNRFLILGGAEQGLPLFCRISHTNNGFSLRKQRLSYTRALEMVRKLLKSIGLKPELYGLHSMRSGGASLVAALGLPDRLVMRHGGWRSESSKTGTSKRLKLLFWMFPSLSSYEIRFLLFRRYEDKLTF